MQWNDVDGGMDPVSSADFMPRQQLKSLQMQRMRAVVRHAYEHVSVFRGRMDAAGVKPDDIRSLDDVRRLPFTHKTDLRDHYPFGLFAVPMPEIVRLHASSGTTGKPIVVAYTAEDIRVWSEVMARSFAACGLSRRDVVQNAYGYGLFTGGLGAHYGAEAIGATVIPISGGNTERQLTVLKDFGVTAICCTPSYFLHLWESAQAQGLKRGELKLKVGVFGAEPWTEDMRARIQREAGIRAHDIYGLSEIIGPGVACECHCQCGPHIFEDHFYPEIIDPKSGEPLPDGAEGELVLTTLSKRAMPMIRYRTHDITSLSDDTCNCGRSLRRIRRIARRSDDMLIIRGVNLYPSQIETALLRVRGTAPHYQIEIGRENDLDTLAVRVEIDPAALGDQLADLEDLRDEVSRSIEGVTGLRAQIHLAEPNSIERSQGKAKRVIDRRRLS
ncbi:MAG: phenylacetate--CoA ligase [Planctomycetes bacterium]|nr:phenylacetate--CoA ligase [Planctomycetota bacterium]